MITSKNTGKSEAPTKLHLAQMDSVRGASDLQKLETQVRLKDAELNAKELSVALQDSKRQTYILIITFLRVGVCSTH